MIHFYSLIFHHGGTMEFSDGFLKGRREHLAAKLTATKQALSRESLLPLAKRYKATVLIPQILLAQCRLLDGTYGYCLECGTKIPEKRLLKHPHVERCVPCQTEVERRK